MELLGWYAYAFAAEPFIVSAVATYVPLFLEQLARRNAVWSGDKRTPCISAPTDSPGLAPPVPLPPIDCVVQVWWGYIDTSSLPLYTFSFSVLAQTLLVISISGIADKGDHRKSLLVGFAVLGALSTIAMYFVHSEHYYIAALCAVMANASFGAVSVCGNAYLPALVDKIVSDRNRLNVTIRDRYYGAVEELEPADPAPIASSISGKGVAIGYGAAFLMQVVTMALLYKFSSGSESIYMLQVVILIVGVWWLVFQIPVILFLPNHIIDPKNPRGPALLVETSLWNDVVSGWRSLFVTITQARKLRDISMFLVGWFIISDTVTTINSTAVLFARGNLQMATPSVAGIGLLVVLFGIGGSLVFGQIRFKRPIDALLIVTAITAVIPCYGVIGFFSKTLGLKHQWEMFVLAAWYGVALGALNAVCRSAFALMIPRGLETMFFALFAVTDKGSSILGPAITGVITDKTHNIRYTFYFLFAMTVLAAFVFARVDIRRGQKDAQSVEDAESPEQDS